MIPDSDRVIELIRETAQTDILPRFRSLLDSEISEKGPNDLVTVADVAAEARLTRVLRDMVAGSVVIGEEAVAEDPERMTRLEGAPPVWVIDPIDGTGNFVAGRTSFAVLVSYLVGGECVAGWIHDPLRDVTAAAMKGEGAWLDGRRLSVAAPAPISAMSGALYYYPRKSKDAQTRFDVAKRRLGSITNLRSAGQEYLMLAEGRIHFAAFSRLNPWDHTAGILIHGESGGHNARLDGRPYHPDWKRDAHWSAERGVLAAPDAKSWRVLQELLFAPFLTVP